MYKKDITEIKESYQKWYQWKKYANEYMYQVSSGEQNVLKPSKRPPVKVDIKFIKNNQKTILYNIKRPYSINSCIAILDGNNIGADTYASFLTRGAVYINNSYNCNLIKLAATKAKIFLKESKIVLAHELTASVDKDNATKIFNLLKLLRDTEQKTIIIVTHDKYIASMCDRIINLGENN